MAAITSSSETRKYVAASAGVITDKAAPEGAPPDGCCPDAAAPAPVMPDNALLITLPTGGGDVYTLLWKPDGTQLAAVLPTRTVVLWDVQ